MHKNLRGFSHVTKSFGSGAIVQLHWRRRLFATHTDVDHLDEHRKRHAAVDITLRNLLSETFGDQRHADQQQEGERQTVTVD